MKKRIFPSTHVINALRANPLMTPLMSPREFAAFKKWAPPKGHILEFGAGGSTYYLLHTGIKSLVSVESDAEWFKQIQKNLIYSRKKWTPFYVDIGETGPFGLPVSKTPVPAWATYHESVWQQHDAKRFDCVFIDGRFRVACALQALLHTRFDTKIIMHDFWNRPHYHCVLDFVHVLEKMQTIAVFHKKKDLDREHIAKLLMDYRFDPR